MQGYFNDKIQINIIAKCTILYYGVYISNKNHLCGKLPYGPLNNNVNVYSRLNTGILL